MFSFVFVFVFVVIIVKCIQNKLVIRFDTFFRKGFKKYTDKYRGFLLGAVNKGTGNPTAVPISLMR